MEAKIKICGQQIPNILNKDRIGHSCVPNRTSTWGKGKASDPEPVFI